MTGAPGAPVVFRSKITRWQAVVWLGIIAVAVVLVAGDHHSPALAVLAVPILLLASLAWRNGVAVVDPTSLRVRTPLGSRVYSLEEIECVETVLDVQPWWWWRGTVRVLRIHSCDGRVDTLRGISEFETWMPLLPFSQVTLWRRRGKSALECFAAQVDRLRGTL